MVKLIKHYSIGLGGFSDEMEFLLSNYFSLKRPSLSAPDKGFMPQTDMFETDDEIVVVMEIAGIQDQEISVTLYSDFLIIRGVRQEIHRTKKRHYHKMEIDYGPFERVIKLPAETLEEEVFADYNNGFLEVRLRKAPIQEIGTEIPIK